jgi:hypothetical protein
MGIQNPQPIPLTQVSNSPPLDLGTGLALFPIDGKDLVIPAGFAVGGTLIDKHVGTRLLGVDLSIGYSVNLGLLGPAWAPLINVQGEYGLYAENPAFYAAYLTRTSGDTTVGGFVAGLAIGISFAVTLSTGFHQHSLNFSVNLDAIALALYAMSKALDEGTFLTKVVAPVLNVLPAYASTWGAFGSDSTSYATSQNGVSISANFPFPVNYWALLVYSVELGTDELGIGEAITAANDFFEGLGFSLTVGPEFALGVTLQPSISGIILEDAAGNTNTFSEGLALGQDSSMTALIPAQNYVPVEKPARIGFQFHQTNRADVQAGFIGQLSLLSLFTLSGSLLFDVTNILHLHVGLGQFDQRLTAPVSSLGQREVVFV